LYIREYIVSALIGTPLQRPVEAIRSFVRLPRRWKKPELRELHLEGERSSRVLRRTITPEMNCIDVGCHLGSGLECIVRLAPRGRHIAIEPLPYKAAWLKRKYPEVEVHQLAIGDGEGDVEFFYQLGKSGWSGLRRHGRGSAMTIRVPYRRLDDIVPPDRPIGFMKIDVEGGEYSLFRGARRILTDSRPVVLFECTRSGLDAFGLSASQVYSSLVEETQYRIFLIKDWLSDGQPLSPAQFEDSMVYPFKAFNYVAAPASWSGPRDRM
jgi:FkbM family methyltransferase